jgi:hypothetical protein
MFRKGGSAGEGITSGLAPRQGYNTNENNTVKQNDLSKINLRDMNMQQIKDLKQAEQRTTKLHKIEPLTDTTVKQGCLKRYLVHNPIFLDQKADLNHIEI